MRKILVFSVMLGVLFIPSYSFAAYADRNFEENISRGGYSTIKTWVKVGYSPGIDTTERDLWSYSGTQAKYIFPTSAAGMEVLSGSAADTGTVLYSGTASGGSTTTLTDSSKNFTSPTSVAAGDLVILDKSGTTPEWGYVTSLTGSTQLNIAGGFSSGGTASGRTYTVVDKTGSSGAQAVKIEYLDGSYAQKTEIVVLSGTTVVPTVNTDLFRVNSFRVIATGSSATSAGNLTLRNLADTPVYSFITAGYTRARNIIYTVPASKTLYVNSFNCAWSTPNDTKVQSARFITRANVEPATMFNTNDIFYGYTETIISNGAETINFDVPTKLPQKTDVRVSGQAFLTGSGSGAVVLRGWLEDN